jgi:hypothetical protein
MQNLKIRDAVLNIESREKFLFDEFFNITSSRIIAQTKKKKRNKVVDLNPETNKLDRLVMASTFIQLSVLSVIHN